MKYETYKELNESLEKLEDFELNGKECVSIGPFKCIRWGKPVDLGHVDSKKRKIRDVVNEKRKRKVLPKKITGNNNNNNNNNSDPINNNHNDDGGVDGHIYKDLLNYAKLTIVSIKGPNYLINDQTIFHIFRPEFFPNIDSDDDWVVEAKSVLSKLVKSEDDSCLIITSLFSKLLNNFTSDLMSFNRLNLKNNYIDIFIIPFVKQIVGELIGWDASSWQFPQLELEELEDLDEIFKSIKMSLIYLVFSLSAFKLSKPIDPDSKDFVLGEYLTMSIYFRKLALTLLNYHMDESDTIVELLKDDELKLENYKILMLMSLIFQIEIDTYLQVYENFELIYAIGDFIIKNIKPRYKLSNLLKLLINIFKIKYIFYESTQSVNTFNYQINQEDEALNYQDLNENYDLITKPDDDDDDDDDEEEDDRRQIKPTIKNLIISNETTTSSSTYQPMSYTVSFNKRDLNGYENAEEIKLPAPKEKQLFIPDENTFTSNIDINSIYLMYGLPKSLLDLFHEIIHLTNHKNIFNRRKVFPRNFPKICAEFEDRLINWTIDQDSNWKLDPDNNPLHQLLTLNIMSFQKALVVYYNQLLKKNCKVKDYQDVIESSLSQFESLLDHQSKLKPLVWNLLIIGSSSLDKSVQERIKTICQKFNYWRCKQILYEVWGKRDKLDGDEESQEFGFMDIVREYGIVLNLG
ncbi:ARG81 Arginine metabolism regulation protein II [Candida maltosa Xu316]